MSGADAYAYAMRSAMGILAALLVAYLWLQVQGCAAREKPRTWWMECDRDSGECTLDPGKEV